MKKKEEFLVRNIAGEYVMMPIGQTALKFNGLIMANSVSSFIWEHIEEVNSIEEMTNLICENFEVDYNQAYNDIKEVINRMKKANWIE